MYFSTSDGREDTTKRQLDGLYYPELEVVELVQDGPRIFWDHLLPSAHVDSFLHYLAVSYK
jgi:hypothetical protein